MKTKDWKKVSSILREVIDLETAEREKYLDELEISDDLRKEVEDLLDIDDSVGDLFPTNALDFSKELFEEEEFQSDNLQGQKIGVYEIKKELGFGGMGAVYLGERVDGKFEQQVAIKMLKREFNSSDIRRRFKKESEIQAKLKHPNIANLIDAGTTEDGIPYLVMEYIEGVRIDKYCRQKGLKLDQILKLFNRVSDAVSFAHQHLIVHRDLKPSNILITESGDPKLLDFGISKLIDEETEEKNTVTNMGVMTPEYASPEQIKGESVSTSTDIYSLGVILFELLSGHRPFESDNSNKANLFKAIIEDEPEKPSVVLDETKTNYSKRIEIKPQGYLDNIEDYEENEIKTEKISEQKTKELIDKTKPQFTNLSPKKLKGDLDNIILKALRKEPSRRYRTVEQFTADIWRYLDGLPVTARPSTFGYRASKFISRNRASVVAGTLVILAIIVGILATLWQARVAQAEAAKAQKTNEFLQKILNFSNPHWLSSNPKRNRNAKIVEALDEALKTIDKDLADEPEVQAEVLLTIGKTYMGQGKYERSQEVLEKAIVKFNQLFGRDNPKSMQARVIIGESLFLRTKFKEAEKNYLEAVNYHHKRLDETDENRKFLAMALAYLSNIYGLQGDFSKAEELNRESMEVAESLTGRNKFVIPIVMGSKGNTLHFQGKYQEALKKYQEALDLMKVQGNDESFESGQLLVSIGACYKGLKKYKLAEENLKKGYEVYKRTVGEKDFFSTNAKFRLGQIYFEQGKLDESEKILKQNLKVQKELFPDGHIYNAYSEIMLGKIYTRQKKYVESDREIRRALEYFSKVHKEPHLNIALAKVSLGTNLVAQQKFEEAEKYLNSALKSYVEINGEEHPSVKEVRQELEKIKSRQSEIEKAQK